MHTGTNAPAPFLASKEGGEVCLAMGGGEGQGEGRARVWARVWARGQEERGSSTPKRATDRLLHVGSPSHCTHKVK